MAIAAAPTQTDKLKLVTASSLMLFVELALIRWTGSNVVYLSYFSNFILLGSFLGIGIGFLRGKKGPDLFPAAPWLLGLFVFFIRAFPVTVNRQGSQLIFFGSGIAKRTLPTWVMLPLIFVAVAAIMIAIAHGVARQFSKFPPLQAYALDIGGSVLGIAAFSALSFLRAEPIVWGVIASVLILTQMNWKLAVASIIPVGLLAGTLIVEGNAKEASWSPYYKVTIFPQPGGGLDIHVNGIPHQALESTETRKKRESVYFLPYTRRQNTPLNDVLIVGAGNGTDVAVALSKGSKHIDAVEIDPRLYEIGRRFHPDHPYQDSRVSIHINDGRAFLEQSDHTYDLILFALPDSLTLVAGQSSLRLESFLFTRQAMETARRHLKPGGVFAMYNFYRERWLVDRLGNTLAQVYGRAPCIDLAAARAHLAMMTVGREDGNVQCATTWTSATSPVPKPATDDYPFLYLRTRGIPSFYLLAIGLILAASLLATRGVGGPFRTMAPFVDLFFMGAAFLLLETKSVIQFALLFGTTWFVNALVFAGILLSVLIAVFIARRVRIPHPERLYLLLLACVAVAFAVPSSALLGLGFGLRFPLAVLISFSPILVANLVFAERFAGVGESTSAFGANLLGAMAGGVLEYSSLVVGYRALLVAVAVIYGLAFLTGRRHLSALSDASVA